MLSRQNRVKSSNLLARLFSSSSSSNNGGGGPNDNGNGGGNGNNNNRWTGESIAVKLVLEKLGPGGGGSIAGLPKNDPLDALFEHQADILGVVRFRHFPLPGHVSTSENYKKLLVPAHSSVYPAADQLSEGLGSPEQHQQIETVRQFGSAAALTNHNRVVSDDDDQSPFGVLTRIHCAAHECPVLVRKDFFDSFPEINLRNQQKLTVVTITEKQQDVSSRETSNNVSPSRHNKLKNNNNTNKDINFSSNNNHKINNSTKNMSDKVDNMQINNDNSSEDMKEAENLTSPTFINAAHEICKILQAAGYWADFVDPFSGKLFSGDFGANSTILETERALDRFAGVTVESSGACQVISHHVTNKRPSVGVVFTTASFDSPILKLIVAAAQSERDEEEEAEAQEGDALEEGGSSSKKTADQSASSPTSAPESHVTTSRTRKDLSRTALLLGKH